MRTLSQNEWRFRLAPVERPCGEYLVGVVRPGGGAKKGKLPASAPLCRGPMRCLLLSAVALVAGRSVPAAKGTVALLTPQLQDGSLDEDVACGTDCENRECEKGCSAQLFCLPDACAAGEKCITEPSKCPDSSDAFTAAMCFQDKTENNPCPAERRAEMCADVKGKVCADRLGHQHRDVQAPLEWKAAHVKKGECVSIIEGTDDEWCRKACTTTDHGECPPDHCVCGDLSDIDMTPVDTVAQAKKNADDLKRLMDSACDFDAQGCSTGVPVPQCNACYIHFEDCRNKAHFEDDMITVKEMTLDDCMDMVAANVAECSTCNTDDSKEAYKVRTGEHDPPGVSQPVKQR